MTKISIDAGGTNIKIGLVENGQIVARGGLPAVSEQGFGPRLKLIIQQVNQLVRKVGINPKTINGVGMAIPGIADANSMKT